MKKILDSNMIKVIAIIAMTIDHITWVVYPGYPKEFVPIVLHIKCTMGREEITKE